MALNGTLQSRPMHERSATKRAWAVITLRTQTKAVELLIMACEREFNCAPNVGRGRGLTLLLRQITGHRLQPTVQQQHRQPQRSHFTFTGRFFFKHAFSLLMLVLNSSGATWGGKRNIFNFNWRALVFKEKLNRKIKGALKNTQKLDVCRCSPETC